MVYEIEVIAGVFIFRYDVVIETAVGLGHYYSVLPKICIKQASTKVSNISNENSKSLPPRAKTLIKVVPS